MNRYMPLEDRSTIVIQIVTLLELVAIDSNEGDWWISSATDVMCFRVVRTMVVVVLNVMVGLVVETILDSSSRDDRRDISS